MKRNPDDYELRVYTGRVHAAKRVEGQMVTACNRTVTYRPEPPHTPVSCKVCKKALG